MECRNPRNAGRGTPSGSLLSLNAGGVYSPSPCLFPLADIFARLLPSIILVLSVLGIARVALVFGVPTAVNGALLTIFAYPSVMKKG